MESSTTDQRKHTRFKISEGCIVITSIGVCRLVDISAGGISFEEQKNEEHSEEFLLNILATEKQTFYEEDIPVKLVWEKIVPHAYIPFFSLKRVGVKFGDTPTPQKARLEHFVRKQATMPEHA